MTASKEHGANERARTNGFNLDFTPQQVWIISANDLLLGDLVYLGTDGDWTRELEDALTIDTKVAAEESLLNAENDSNSVVSANLVSAITTIDQQIELTHFRDRFRESGPTHRGDLSRRSLAAVSNESNRSL